MEKQLLKQLFRLLKEDCGVEQYETAKTVYQDLGTFTNPEACNIDVSEITIE
jgi:hypothetical protein